MESTHTFVLPCGVECEVREMTGKHQRILTEQKNKSVTENLNEILADCVVRVGSMQNVDAAFIKKMLSADRKKILIELRQFSLDFPEQFTFTWDYLNKEGEKAKEQMVLDLTGGFETKNYRKQVKDYADVERDVMTTLPNGKEVRWSYMTSEDEQRASRLKKADRSSHTMIDLRNPVEFHQGASDKVPVRLDLDKLRLKDIEHLRKEIKDLEADVDTMVRFEHPEAEFKAPGEKEVVVDLVSQIAFFFPSEAI